MMKILPILITCLLTTGCFEIAPKADKLAEVKADLNARLVGMEAQLTGIKVGNIQMEKLAQLDTKIALMEQKMQVSVQGDGNKVTTGMFSGSGIYAVIVAVVLGLGCIVLAWRVVVWKQEARMLKRQLNPVQKPMMYEA